MDGTRSITETYYMLLGLLKKPGSELRSAYFGIDRYDTTDLMLVDLFNSIVAGYHADRATKNKIFKKIKQPRQLDEYGEPIEKKMITVEELKKKFAYVVKAKPKEEREVSDGTIQEVGA